MPDKIMTSLQTIAHYACCGNVRKPVQHGVNPPPVDQGHLEDNHESASRTPGPATSIPDTPTGQRIRTSLSSEVGRPAGSTDGDTFSSLLASLGTNAETAAGTSSAAGGRAATNNTALEKINGRLQAAVSDQDRFNEVSHALLHELMDAPPPVQRQVGANVLARFGDRLSPLASTAANAALYAADVHDRYHPAHGLPRQYGWEVSPVNRGLYDVMIAALRSHGTLPHPLYRMPRLDQMAAEIMRQAHDSDAPAHGFAIARMASFFHQVAFHFHVDRNDGEPVLHVMAVDSEKRGKEIALQLRDSFKGGGCKVNIAAINGGTQFSPAGCPMFSPFNIESMNADPQALNALMQNMKQWLPLHGKTLFSLDSDPSISITVYNGEEFLWPAFYDICQSKTTLTQVAARVQTPARTRMRDVVDNSGKTRNANVLLEYTHEERTAVMLGYLKALLGTEPADGNAMLQTHIREVRQSSLGDDDDLKMDRHCAAAQLADEVGEPVIWMDVSPLMQDVGRRQELLAELDRCDGPARMKLGYLQKHGYPVFSDWYVQDGRTFVKDDRYFHVFPEAEDQAMQPSDYMGSATGIRDGAQYNFVAFARSEFDDRRSAFEGLPLHEVEPRIGNRRI